MVGDHDRGAEFPERPKPGQKKAGQQRGPGQGEADVPEHGARTVAERGRNVLQPGIDACNSLARAMAPFTPFSRGVSSRRAPR